MFKSLKNNSIITNIGLPRIIISVFFIFLCFAAVGLELPIDSLLSDAIKRIGMNLILVLAMVTAIQSGIGLNFGIALGIVGGVLAGLLSIEFGFTGVGAFVFSIVLGFIISGFIGYGYGLLLNRVKSSEMTISTYAGFSIVSFMCMVWLFIPLKNPAIGWSIGSGLRNTISLESTSGNILNNFLKFQIVTIDGKIQFLTKNFINGGFVIPTGLILFSGLMCFFMWLFLRSKLGIAMSAAGNNPRFAQATGINVDNMRILGTVISTALGAVGILVYAQSFGFLQLYNAPMFMSFSAVASILLGGASVRRARVSHVIIGTILFQGLLTLGLPVANLLAPEGNLSEVLRMVVSNGIILFALTQAQGGDSNV